MAAIASNMHAITNYYAYIKWLHVHDDNPDQHI